MIPLGIPSFPCPARPPMPKISPLRTSKETSRTVSPGISTQRCSTAKAAESDRTRSCLSFPCSSTWRPTIQEAISRTEALPASASRITSPSLRTTMRSHSSLTSCRRCEMKMIPMPLSASFFSAVRRICASVSVRTAVGSSRKRRRVCLRSISRAISINCLYPTGISATTVSTPISTPRVRMALPARSRIALRFRVAMRSLKTCSNRDLLRTSRLSRMFSAAVKPGMRENS